MNERMKAVLGGRKKVEIQQDTWLFKLYSTGLDGLGEEHMPENENLCHFMRTAFIWGILEKARNITFEYNYNHVCSLVTVIWVLLVTTPIVTYGMSVSSIGLIAVGIYFGITGWGMDYLMIRDPDKLDIRKSVAFFLMLSWIVPLIVGVAWFIEETDTVWSEYWLSLKGYYPYSQKTFWSWVITLLLLFNVLGLALAGISMVIIHFWPYIVALAIAFVPVLLTVVAGGYMASIALGLVLGVMACLDYATRNADWRQEKDNRRYVDSDWWHREGQSSHSSPQINISPPKEMLWIWFWIVVIKQRFLCPLIEIAYPPDKSLDDKA